MTWADAFFALGLAILCVGGLLARRWMGGLDHRPPRNDRAHRP